MKRYHAFAVLILIGFILSAVETHAQVEFAVVERHLLNARFGELNVVAADRGCLLPGARQHVRRDVCSDIADLLAPA